MDRKPLAIVIGLLAFVAGAFGTRYAVDWIRSEPRISAGVLAHEWVEESIGSSGVTVSVPWHLQSKPLELPPELARLIVESTTLTHEADGLNVMAVHMTFVPGTATNLEGAADGAIANLRTVPGTTSVQGSKHEVSVAGERAFEIEAAIERERGVPLRMRGVVFGNGPELYQLLLICRGDQESGATVWGRLRDGIRRKAA